ncbi:MAG: SIS domain-containing protein [Candidatus Cloacimonetes bacterium]|nr:SIS domain-containing protein [Candidatus Cloacimonadota bacterium]NLO12150.1 SIS domain-containing protein [Candidatus Cloacimonadota bacterium]
MFTYKLLHLYNKALASLAKRLQPVTLRIPVPIFGVGCGVLGLSLGKVSVNMGKHASTLLKSLEYRGFDSTGAAFQADGEEVVLLKDVGAPSTLVKTLGIEKQKGSLFCGQVRWATYSMVSKENAQPFVVNCKQHIYGAHNGNITNTRELEVFLTKEGHNLQGTSDGEMLVHTVEHYLDIEIKKAGRPTDHESRRACMRKAIIAMSEKLVGSYAAVIVDPVTRYSWAIKAGSSLYFGVGELDDSKFGLASSDLTSVLRFTKMIVNLREGEFIEYAHDNYQVYALKNLRFRHLKKADEVYVKGQEIGTKAVYSRLRAEDVELMPEFDYFMEQEIYAQVESTGKLAKLFAGGSNSGRTMLELLREANLFKKLTSIVNPILDTPEFEEKQKLFDEYCESEEWNEFYKSSRKLYPAFFDVAVKEDFAKKYFFSNEMNIFIDLIGSEFDFRRITLAKSFDAICEQRSVQDFEKKVKGFLDLIVNTNRNNRIAYTIACGTSFHATKVGALFFNEIAGVEIIPILPGDFRGEYSNCVKDHDLVIGVSQSGETKDLIDIFNDIEASGLNISRVVLVNNVNSTLGQEKSDIAIPILCGPEIAVPATKSFVNQIMLFYYLAIRTAEAMLKEHKKDWDAAKVIAIKEQIEKRKQSLDRIPGLLKETLESTADIIDSVAAKIYMEPSLHILATKITGVAMEGALKIRETVLNHAEGREASEFKHGPNTILGKNTVFGFKHVRSFVRSLTALIDQMETKAFEKKIDRTEFKEMIPALTNFIFNSNMPFNLSKQGDEVFKEIIKNKEFFEPIYRKYPLIYVTGPDERDVNLTISQINTHKIRGADTYVIAEENDHLLKNASHNPNEGGYYGWGYIMLPRTGDSLLTCFSATAVLQLLAFKMSVRKMKRLDRINMLDHGVHPDVPKNVSKSITVD